MTEQHASSPTAPGMPASGCRLLVVSGKLASGKDTVAPAVMTRLDCPAPVKVAVADAVRAEATTLLAVIRATGSVSAAARALTRHAALPPVHAHELAALMWPALQHAPTLTAADRTPQVRRFLQYLGTDVRRAVDPGYWVRPTLATTARHLAAGHSVYLTDVRFPNEVDALRAAGGFAVRLTVTPTTQATRLTGRDGIPVDPVALSHPSETALDNYPGFDLVVSNDGALATTVATVARAVRARP